MQIRVDTESHDALILGDSATTAPSSGAADGSTSRSAPANGGHPPASELLVRAPVAAAGVAHAERTVKPKMRKMKRREQTALGIALFVLPLLLLTQVVAIWPSAIAATANQAQPHVPWLFGLAHSTMTIDETLFVLVAMVGALASLAASSFRFAMHAGREELSSRWTWSYLLRPVQGATLAVVVYFVLRAGLLGNSAVKAQDPYGIAAIAALIGLFSTQALQKLKDVFNTLWGVDDPDSNVVARAPASAGGAKTGAGVASADEGKESPGAKASTDGAEAGADGSATSAGRGASAASGAN